MTIPYVRVDCHVSPFADKFCNLISGGPPWVAKSWSWSTIIISPYYVPLIRENIMQLANVKCLSTFDANYTISFCLPFGKFQYKRLPMKISTASNESSDRRASFSDWRPSFLDCGSTFTHRRSRIDFHIVWPTLDNDTMTAIADRWMWIDDRTIPRVAHIR